jgi:transposase InsO family protein
MRDSKILLREIIPSYGLPLSITSDNGPAFLVEIVQGLAKILKIKWKLHTAYRPQSSGKVERMNHTLKIALPKLCQETQSPWIDILPLALCTPRPSGYSPFEILYGRPSPIINRFTEDLRQIGNLDMSDMSWRLKVLGKTLRHISQEVLERTPIPFPR